jgi:hypothetical protein
MTDYTTNVPPPIWTDQGLQIPTQAQILAGNLADWNAATGGNVNTENLNTSQGQQASSLTAIIWQCYSTMLTLVNSISPAAAQSFMQDAIGYLFFLTREAGTATAVQCTCTGLVDTPITVGTLARDTAGNIYQCTEAGDISVDSSVSLTFENVVDGPIPCPSGTLTAIVTAITGWSGITNPEDGVPGTNTESAPAFGSRIQASASVNAQGTNPALRGTLANLPGVTATYVISNNTAFAMQVGPTNYSLLPSSLYAAVVGGAAAAIAQAIWVKKGDGCNTNGNQTITVYDTTYPAGSQPAYSISYNVPHSVDVTFVCNYAKVPAPPSNIVTLVQNAIINQFENGNQWTPAVSIGSTILQSTYVEPVRAASPGLALLSIGIGTAFTGTGSVTNGSTTLTIATLTAGSFMSAGNVITATGVPAGATPTYIVTQLSGTIGGVGTYQMSAEAASDESGEAVTSTTGNGTSWQAGIDQIPVIEAANISVTIGPAIAALSVAIAPTTLSVTGASASETTSSATATPAGGVSPYGYAWTWSSGGTGITINSPSAAATTFTASALTAGQTLTGTAQCQVSSTDGQIATATVSVSITRVSVPAATSAPTSLSIVGSAANQTTAPCAASVAGGASPYTYLWTWQSGGSGIVIDSATSASTQFSASGLAVNTTVSGVALCTVTDAYGQTATTTCSVSIERVTAVSASVSPTSFSISGLATTQSTGTCTVSASGGSGSYTYAWTWSAGGANLTINSPSAATTSFTGSGMVNGTNYSGTAQCIVTDGYGQTATVTVSVAIDCEANIQHIYNGPNAGTETIPPGATTVIIESQAGGAPGGEGNTTFGTAGGGGGAGGYCRSSYSVTPGNTLNYSAGGPTAGSSVSSGTQSITTMTANTGTAGTNANGSGAAGHGGPGGSASGGNQANVTGGTGVDGSGTAAGGIPPAGIYVNTDQSKGTGGQGNFNTTVLLGVAGVISFYYT